jgi:Family of unknown function (DUF5681)
MAKFEKGRSGNPGGRPKESDDVKALARQHGPAAVLRLVEWMKSDNAKASVSASQALLDRGYGKPTQPIAGDAENPLTMMHEVGRSLDAKLVRLIGRARDVS